MVFLLSKDPTTTSSGDMEMNRILLDLAARDHDVTVICLSEQPDLPPEPGLVRVAKPEVNALAIAWRSLRRRRSLVFARFDTDELVAAIEATDADVYVAVHRYMAESFLRSTRAGGPAPLLVCAVVSEAVVWANTRGLVGRQQVRRITADERRIARAADAMAAYEQEEAEQALAEGARRSVWLELTRPPLAAIDIAVTGPRLLMLGDRTWGPNQEAYRSVLELWPDIARGIDGAELIIVGKPAEQVPQLPDGASDLGFVDDLEGTIASCRAMVAPVSTGGGVRVKILEAASRGLPVVGTSVAIGSLGPILGLTPHDDPADFVAACRALLLDPAAATAEGSRLHAANADHWSTGRPQQTFDTWVAP